MPVLEPGPQQTTGNRSHSIRRRAPRAENTLDPIFFVLARAVSWPPSPKHRESNLTMTIDKNNEIRRETNRKGCRETHDLKLPFLLKVHDGILVSSEKGNSGIDPGKLPFGIFEDHNEPGTFYSDPGEAFRLINPSAGHGQRLRVYSDNVAATKFVLDRLYKHK